jgi:hypothetical protein
LIFEIHKDAKEKRAREHLFPARLLRISLSKKAAFRRLSSLMLNADSVKV